MRIIIPAIFVLLISFTGRLSAQESKPPLISGHYDEWDFDAFSRWIEGSTPYHFFYNPAQTDSLCIRLTVQDQTLDQVLNKIFEGTTFHFMIDEQGEVFITKGLQIRTGLPEGFFGKKPAAIRDSVTYSDLTNTSLKHVTSENKLYDIGRKTNTIGTGTAIISGYIRNAATGEPIAGAAIYSTTPQISTITDQYGYFSINLPKGHHTLNVQGLGMRDSRYQMILYSDGKLDIDMREQVTTAPGGDRLRGEDGECPPGPTGRRTPGHTNHQTGAYRNGRGRCIACRPYPAGGQDGRRGQYGSECEGGRSGCQSHFIQ